MELILEFISLVVDVVYLFTPWRKRPDFRLEDGLPKGPKDTRRRDRPLN